MLKRPHLLFAALVLVAGQSVGAEETVRIEAGMAAPSWTLPGIDGGTVMFPADAAGRPAVFLFWATWCPYCRALMPYLQGIREDYAADGVRVFAINFKEDGDPVAHLRELGFDFLVALEGDPVAGRYGVKYAPGLFVVDGAGQVIYRRKSTHARPGKSIAKFWNAELRERLDAALAAAEAQDK